MLYQTARGVADRNYGVPNRVETKFNLRSMNKMFTAVVAARLVEQGKVLRAILDEPDRAAEG